MVREQANSDALMALGEALVRPDGLIGAWAPLVCHVCSCLELPAPTRSAAVLTLCKLMATSGAFCEEQLPLLFTLMGREPEQAVRFERLQDLAPAPAAVFDVPPYFLSWEVTAVCFHPHVPNRGHPRLRDGALVERGHGRCNAS